MIFRESAIRLISRWKAWFSSSSRSWSFGAAAAITSWCSASSSATFWSVGLAVAWGCEFPGDEGLDLEEVPDLLAGQGCHYEPLPWHDLQEALHAQGLADGLRGDHDPGPEFTGHDVGVGLLAQLRACVAAGVAADAQPRDIQSVVWSMVTLGAPSPSSARISSVCSPISGTGSILTFTSREVTGGSRLRSGPTGESTSRQRLRSAS